jgi:hypothetical protein
MPRLTGILLLAIALCAAARTAQAAEIGHFNGGILNIRDYFVPEPGLYGGLYNYFYHTGRLNDRHGDEIHSVTINPRGGPEVTVGVDVDVNLYALAPVLFWVTDLKPLGLPLKYGAVITPSFANASLEATLSRATRLGGTVEHSSFNVGDLYVQPVWLGLTLPHWDFAFAYGFYAPTGHYNTETVTLPSGGSLTVESSDNIGYGFWTNQLQGAVAWYPWTHKATAVTAALTYEINTNKHDFDLTPGQRLTLNWGISQYVPLTRDQKLLLEIGPAGYDSWQISDDTGSDARNGEVHDYVHAVGGQLGLTYLPWQAALNFHAFYEFSAQDRFQGQAFNISLVKKFW